MLPPHEAHLARPVSRTGPVTTRGGLTRGLRALSTARTRSNVSLPMIAGASQ
jgi:hypothetical protein